MNEQFDVQVLVCPEICIHCQKIVIDYNRYYISFLGLPIRYEAENSIVLCIECFEEANNNWRENIDASY